MRSALACLMLVCASLVAVAQQAPSVMNYQGRLTDNSPQRQLLDGDFSAEFRIYDSETDGNPLWSESWPAVAVRRGIFSLLLGSNGSSVPATVFAGGPDRFLEVVVDGEVMTPRQKIGSSGYTFVAEPLPGAEGPPGAPGPTGSSGVDGTGGPMGSVGEAGPAGDAQAAGSPGASGANGADGMAGTQGPQGPTGPPETLEPIAPSSTKGDLLAETGTGMAALPAGAANHILVADPTQPTGLRWSTPAKRAARGAIPPPAPVPQTGQMDCFPSPCSGTGQDGDLQSGVTLPQPRFTDNADGTVRDNLTGLIWTKDADCIGSGTLANALADSAALASGDCGLTDGSVAGDWRIPNVLEMLSLTNYAYSNPTLSNAAGTAVWSEGDPFNNVVSALYYSTTTHLESGSKSCVNLVAGEIRLCGATDFISYRAWAVRDAQ